MPKVKDCDWIHHYRYIRDYHPFTINAVNGVAEVTLTLGDEPSNNDEGMLSVCPFCGTPLNGEVLDVRIFNDEDGYAAQVGIQEGYPDDLAEQLKKDVVASIKNYYATHHDIRFERTRFKGQLGKRDSIRAVCDTCGKKSAWYYKKDAAALDLDRMMCKHDEPFEFDEILTMTDEEIKTALGLSKAFYDSAKREMIKRHIESED